MSPQESTNSQKSYSIREAVVSDAEQISALYKRVWDEYEHQFPKALLESRQPTADVMLQWMMKETYFVGELNGSIIGVVGCRLMHGTCQLTHMAVDRLHRGKGIGTGLTKRAIEFAKDSNSFKIWLDTAPFMKEAITLYEKFGFAKCGYLKKHFWGLDMELYELVLSP
ncbi:MAG: GNAT family N-acetyltransferase [Candidatus Thorarchaeota archaeon]|jgi:ribosomal protein S18 acetylase RimI-like enzyme